MSSVSTIDILELGESKKKNLPTIIEPGISQSDVLVVSEDDAVINDEFSSLSTLYGLMMDIDYIKNIKLDDLKASNDRFKKELRMFERHKIPDRYKSRVEIFEKTLSDGQNREEQLKLFNEPSHFDEVIEIKVDTDLVVITDISIISTLHSSTSIIFKAKYLTNICHILKVHIIMNGLCRKLFL